jgi:hypothetical protein
MGEVNMKSRVRTRTHGSERGRGFLSPTYSIKLQIIASRDLKDTSEMANIISKKIKPVIFVQQKEQEITYTYEKTSDLGTEKKSFKVTIKAPDFQEAMKNIYRTSSFSEQKPMFIHVTRF